MPEEYPVDHPLPAREKPPRNLPGKLTMILIFVIGGIAVVLTAYFVADNYPIFDDQEPAPIERVTLE